MQISNIQALQFKTVSDPKTPMCVVSRLCRELSICGHRLLRQPKDFPISALSHGSRFG
jgi:hypothetical protein